MRLLGRYLVLTAALAATVPAGAQEFDPASLDLAALIECRADVPTYNGFALWLAEGTASEAALGWHKAESGNPFLQQYELPAPVKVFGREARSVAFSSNAILAILDGVSGPDLARELGAAPAVQTADKFLGEKAVVQKTEDADGMSFVTRIALNVSTVDSHPGKVLAGCSYAMDVK